MALVSHRGMKGMRVSVKRIKIGGITYMVATPVAEEIFKLVKGNMELQGRIDVLAGGYIDRLIPKPPMLTRFKQFFIGGK